MLVPIATVGVNLAALGLKLLGEEHKLLDVLGHPIDLIAGHLSADSALELGERLKKWYSGNERIAKEDLERAVAKSTILADLFCLLDALPAPQERLGVGSQIRERFEKWLPESQLQGVISQMERDVLRSAVEACEKQIEEIEKGDFVAPEIDPKKLILPKLGADWGAELALAALAKIRLERPALPDRVDAIFKSRWFPYVCLAFQEQIKTNTRVSAIFLAMQIATGFVDIGEAIRHFQEENRKEHAEILKLSAPLRLVLSQRRWTHLPRSARSF